MKREAGVDLAVVGVTFALSEDGSRSKAGSDLDAAVQASAAKLKRVTPEPMVDGEYVDQLRQGRQRAVNAKNVAADQSAALTTALAVTSGPASWAPGYTEVWAANVNGQAKITTYNSWDSNAPTDPRSPFALPEDWGIEFDITQYNYAVQPGPTDYDQYRPGCAYGNYNKYWAARNAGSTPFAGWSVAYPAQSINPSAIGAYADWDDMFDPCPNQSMAIGIGYPRNLQSSYGFTDVMTNIYATRGLTSSSLASGAIQAVSNDCNDIGQGPGSACMGLNTGRDLGQPKSQIILGLSRGWHIPRCWNVVYPNAPQSFDCSIGPWG